MSDYEGPGFSMSNLFADGPDVQYAEEWLKRTDLPPWADLEANPLCERPRVKESG